MEEIQATVHLFRSILYILIHSDWDSLYVHDGRYDIQLFSNDLFHPTSFTAFDEDDSNGGY